MQQGEDPTDWKPVQSIGVGVREIRIRDKRGIFRVMYVAKLASAVYVLHCFQKKTQKTAPGDLVLAKQRFNELIREVRR